MGLSVACPLDLVEYKPGPVLLRSVGFLACSMRGSRLAPCCRLSPADLDGAGGYANGSGAGVRAKNTAKIKKPLFRKGF